MDGAAAPIPDSLAAERRRTSNERIAAAARSHRFDDRTPVPFICECADTGCGELVRLTLADLAAARRIDRYLVAPGHAAGWRPAIADTAG